MKITIDGKVRLNGALLRYLQGLVDEPRSIPADETPLSAETIHAIEEFVAQDEMSETEFATATIVGHPDEDLPRGMVLLSCGPVSIECDAADLRRAMLAF